MAKPYIYGLKIYLKTIHTFIKSFTRLDFDMDEPLFENERKAEEILSAVFDTGYDQYLVQVFPDNQARLARKSSRHDSWTPGWWTIATRQESVSKEENG